MLLKHQVSNLKDQFKHAHAQVFSGDIFNCKELRLDYGPRAMATVLSLGPNSLSKEKNKLLIIQQKLVKRIPCVYTICCVCAMCVMMQAADIGITLAV